MGLGKFMTGRIHQMRAQKSYLAAHPSWFDTSPSKLCPLCGDEEETFSHAVLSCPAKAATRLSHLQGVSSVAPDSPLWSSSPLLLALASYIRETGTNFPLDMPLRTTSLPRLNGLSLLSPGPPSLGAPCVLAPSSCLRSSHVEER